MRDLFAKLREHIAKKEDVAFSTIIASSGSVPRGAGARMLVAKEGRLAGTVGGGAVEYACILKSQEIIKDKKALIYPYRLRKNRIEDLGMICGGDVDIHFSYIEANEENKKLFDKIEEFYEKGEASWFIIDISENGNGAISIYGKESGFFGAKISAEIIKELKDKPRQIQIGDKTYYAEKLVNAEKVYIFGGGHVSQSLVPVLAKLNFRCIVLEDREEFCKPELFKGVEKTMLIDNERVADFITINEEDYVCIMTRGHKADTITQAQAIKSPAHYIGVIGSRRKVEAVKAKLRGMGISNEEIARVTTPIGIEIQAETPDEIAISIAAQLIQVRAARN